MALLYHILVAQDNHGANNMKYLIIAVALVLGGCTSASHIRVIEYGGGGVVTPFTGEVGGCSVYETTEKVVAKMVYSGKSCIVEVDK